MSEVFKIDREFLFKTNIFEIASISIEQNNDIDGSCIEGEFIVSGTYRLHEISINKEDFCYKIPFKHELRSNINLDTVELDITDFSYDFKAPDELEVHIEYILKAEESIKEFEDEDTLNDFLNTKDLEIVDLRDDSDEVKTEVKDEDERFDANLPGEEAVPIPVIQNESAKETNAINQDMIIDSINKEDEYVLYHIHTVTVSDTIESITKKYNISINKLKEYNTFETLELNMKILIPNEEL